MAYLQSRKQLMEFIQIIQVKLVKLLKIIKIIQVKLVKLVKLFKLNLTGPRKFDISFCVIFSCFNQSLIYKRETGH